MTYDKDKIKNHFQKTDPILFEAYTRIDQPIILTPHTNYFASLCESIISINYKYPSSFKLRKLFSQTMI